MRNLSSSFLNMYKPEFFKKWSVCSLTQALNRTGGACPTERALQHMSPGCTMEQPTTGTWTAWGGHCPIFRMNQLTCNDSLRQHGKRVTGRRMRYGNKRWMGKKIQGVVPIKRMDFLFFRDKFAGRISSQGASQWASLIS